MPIPAPDDAGEPIILDGSNIARRAGSFAALVAMEEGLQDAGWTVLVVVDASLRHRLGPDDQALLEDLLDAGWFQVTKGVDADTHILAEAARLDAWVVSHDQFRDHTPPRRRLDPALIEA